MPANVGDRGEFTVSVIFQKPYFRRTYLLPYDGNRHGVDLFLNQCRGRYYVYLLCRPDGRPFYVGKGINRRVLEHEAEARRAHPIGETNPFKCNVIRKIIREGGDIRYQIVALFDSDREQDCLLKEASLIQRYGRLHEGGPLTNLAGGLGNLSGAAPSSIRRHAATLSGSPEDNPERATLNGFLQSIGPVGSVPIKPISQIARIVPTTPHPKPRQPTKRCAYALVASASAAGLRLSDGIEIPRSFSYCDVTAIVENGVARDLIKAKMATLIPTTSPKNERFKLSSLQVGILVELLGHKHLSDRGLL